ncbi:hypothetical protein HMN09_00836600 [Mycena chlorophos]|uniref:Uncharacterized protein n=1 Tax=Mycena chlorophos TaxID=658473 RepID=A0A8H6SU03_MYCCL|nr:hypothetical protein HMN09_00836600 [Mycena chlorophos]
MPVAAGPSCVVAPPTLCPSTLSLLSHRRPVALAASSATIAASANPGHSKMPHAAAPINISSPQPADAQPADPPASFPASTSWSPSTVRQRPPAIRPKSNESTLPEPNLRETYVDDTPTGDAPYSTALDPHKHAMAGLRRISRLQPCPVPASMHACAPTTTCAARTYYTCLCVAQCIYF